MLFKRVIGVVVGGLSVAFIVLVFGAAAFTGVSYTARAAVATHCSPGH